MTEAFGYLASALVVLSLTMRSILRLRIISLCGSTTFVVYGVLIESIPIVLTNGSIALINLWYLRKEFLVRRSGNNDLGASPIRHDSPFLRDFIEYHASDIRKFQPDFRMPTPEGGDADVVALMLTRDGLPAGLVVGRRRDDTMWIDLDYVLREHRDSRLGNWLFGSGAEVFRELGVRHLRADGLTDAHRKYLRGIGFAVTSGGSHDAADEFELII